MSAYSIPRRFGWTKSIIYTAFLVLGLFHLPAFAVTAPVGATPGSFSVNQNGGATNAIPITAPPGTAGMAPKLALSYDKQVQNDLLAIGWSVRGLSLIQRCGRTIAHDGMKGGVNYDANDRFCLDGQRLVAINNGVYGANGTEYRTEKEGFNRIISYRDDMTFTGSGPQFFKITTKLGTVMEYGVSADSRIEAQGKPTVRLWALNKIQDTKGNYLAISYSEDNANGEYHPTRIDYTGNTNAALTPYNSVQFVYGPRTDITPRYEGGSVIKTTQRLINVKTCTGVTSTQLCTDLGVSLVRDYQLAYDNNGAVGGSRLISVTECGSDGVCLPATTFGYQNGSTGFTVPDPTKPALPATIGGYVSWNNQAQYMQLGDFNGDGKIDYAWIPYGQQFWLIAYGTDTGFTVPDPTKPALPATIGGYASWNTYAQNMQFGDFNGDGKIDYAWRPSNGDGRWLIAYGTDTGFTVPDPTKPALPATIGGYYSWNDQAQYMQFGDFNGDGKLDYAWIPSGAQFWLIAYGTDTGFTVPDPTKPALPATIGGYASSNNQAQYMQFRDFNGDGKLDYAWIPYG